MNIKTVETLPMSGILSDPFYKLDGTQESVSLDWSYVNNSFDLIDRNIDYSKLPIGSSDFVKKAFLTYNGISCQTKEIIETVLMESANTADPDFLPGFNNSNEWTYQPANFRLPAELQSGLSNDLIEWPYPFSEGATLIKTFLNSQSNTVQPLYTAYYRRPLMTTFELGNVEGSKVYTDGWYSSYVIAVKKHSVVNPNPNLTLSCQKGLIVFCTDNNFYINITGTCIEPGNFFIPDPNGGLLPVDSSLPQYDTINWKVSPSFQEWMDFLKMNYVNTFAGAGGQNVNNAFTGALSPNLNNGYSAILNQSKPSANAVGLVGNPSPANIVTALDPVFYIECNHLATPELQANILLELKKLCGCCKEDKFNMSHIENWVKLKGKLESSFIYFNEESFKASQEIIVSSRTHCCVCLSDSDNCNFNYLKKCS